MKQILLVDDHQIIRNGIKYYFEDSKDFHVSAEAENGVEALEKLKNEQFDLLITDISMPEMDGIELIKQIKEQGIDIKILALTMHGEAKIIKQVMQLGIDGYIIKNSGRDKVLEALGQIFSGQAYFSYEVTKAIMDDLSNKPQKKDRLTMEVSLSKRETEVLDLIVQEMNNHQIAEKLFISVRTVESHKQSLLYKTGSKNVAGLVLYAMNHI